VAVGLGLQKRLFTGLALEEEVESKWEQESYPKLSPRTYPKMIGIRCVDLMVEIFRRFRNKPHKAESKIESDS
jgi:hypothetical protein